MEPERQIEKLLRAVAKKRREQAGDPMELKGTARQLLHKEISRRAPGKGAGSFLENLFSGLHPRLAFALCLLAIASVGAWFLAPLLAGRKPATLASANLRLAEAPIAAQKKPMPDRAPPIAAPPSMAEDKGKSLFDDNLATSSGAPARQQAQPTEAGGNRAPVLSDRKTSKLSSEFKNENAQTNPLVAVSTESAPPADKETPTLKPAAPLTDSFASAGRLDSDGTDATRRSIATATAAKGTVAPTTTLAAAEPEAQKKLSLEKAPVSPPAGRAAFSYSIAKDQAAAAVPVASQRFYRMETPATRQRAAGALSVPPRVLVSFKVEQNGEQMRVVDADGSVYTGALEVTQAESNSPGAASATLQNNPSTVRAAKARIPQPPGQNYFFRVAGTNRNLNQNVVFSGNLIPLPNVLPGPTNAGLFGGAVGGGGGGGALHSVPSIPATPLLSNSRISGKAVIGDQKEIEVNATPVP